MLLCSITFWFEIPLFYKENIFDSISLRLIFRIHFLLILHFISFCYVIYIVIKNSYLFPFIRSRKYITVLLNRQLSGTFTHSKWMLCFIYRNFDFMYNILGLLRIMNKFCIKNNLCYVNLSFSVFILWKILMLSSFKRSLNKCSSINRKHN